MIFKTKKLTNLLSLGIVVSLISITACSTTTPGGPKGTNDVDSINKSKPVVQKSEIKKKLKNPLVDNDLNIQIEDYTFSYGTDKNNDSGENEHAEGLVNFKNLGKHKVIVDEENYSASGNKPDVMTITDKDTGNVITFSAAQILNSIIISDGKNEMTIAINPDGTFLVNKIPAKNAKEASTIAFKESFIAGTSRHIFVMLHELLKNSKEFSVKIQNQDVLTIESFRIADEFTDFLTFLWNLALAFAGGDGPM
jgi:hypothetical protein